MNDFLYVGQELELFAHAKNWKRYWSSFVRPFVAGDVLEVGAGVGSNTVLLREGCPTAVRSWTCLEPDSNLAAQLRDALGKHAGTADCRVAVGTTRSFDGEAQFDCIVYIDVLEHIEDDRQELRWASRLLRPGGHLVVLAPAHQWLFTPFDKAIGHFRRYTRRTLRQCSPAGCRLQALQYLDSCGLLASLGNRMLLQQANPTLKQIQFWDGRLVPVSTILDRMLGFRLGKSVLGIWMKS